MVFFKFGNRNHVSCNRSSVIVLSISFWWIILNSSKMRVSYQTHVVATFDLRVILEFARKLKPKMCCIDMIFLKIVSWCMVEFISKVRWYTLTWNLIINFFNKIAKRKYCKYLCIKTYHMYSMKIYVDSARKDSQITIANDERKYLGKCFKLQIISITSRTI